VDRRSAVARWKHDLEPTPTGIARVRISDDTVIETVATDSPVLKKQNSDDGLTLVVASLVKLFVIDRW